MGNPEANVKQISILLENVNLESNQGGNCNGNKSEKLYLNKLSPSIALTVKSEIAEAEERAKKLEHDYLLADKKFRETWSHWWSFECEKRKIGYRCQWDGYCVDDCKKMVEQLQTAVGKLSSTQATSRETETSDHRLRCLKLHGAKSLAQEKVLLRQKTKSQQQDEDELSHEKIDSRRIKWEFNSMQRAIKKYGCKKQMHYLLREVKEVQKLREKAIMNGALEDNPESRDCLTKSVENEIRLLKKMVRELEKDCRERESILENARRTSSVLEKKKLYLQKESEDLCKKWNEEKKHIGGLKKKLEHLQRNILS